MRDEQINYSAIVVDTCIFLSQGFRMNSHPLNGLKQFNRTPVSVLVPEVINSECLEHLSKNIEASRNKVDGSISNLLIHKVIDESLIHSVRNAIRACDTSRDMAKRNLEGFYHEVGAEQLEISKYVDAGKLYELYFGKRPPFGKDKKKHEFPDAAALMSIQKWAENQNSNVVFVSSDKDWKAFSETFSRIKYFDDLDKALEYFQPSEDVGRIKAFLNEQEPFEAEELAKDIERSIKNIIKTIYVHAESPLKS